MVNNSIAIGLDALGVIDNEVKTLHSHDGIITDDELWGIGSERASLPQAFESMSPLLREALVDMKQLESVKVALYNLAHSCERKLEIMKKDLWPCFLQCGIQMLPDDVLARIFELCVEGNQDDRAATMSPEVVLSHVSTRFRSVALSLPSLWSKLSSKMSKRCLQRNLKRSGVVALYVTISGHAMSKRLALFIRNVKRECSRWKSFKFHLDDVKAMDSGFLKQLRISLGDLQLPNLELFELSHNCRSGNTDAVTNIDSFNIYRSWSMPKTRHISICENTPSNLRGPFSLQAVSFLSLSFPADGGIRLQPLLETLASMSNLSDLQLEISCYWYDIPGKNISFVFPSLKSLSLLVGLITGRFFMDYARMPILEHLHLETSKRQQTNVYYQPYRLLPDLPRATCPSVKKLVIVYRGSRPNYLDFFSIVDRFPGMEILVLDAPFSKLSFHLGEVRMMPPFRFISMQVGEPACIDFLPRFVEEMKQHGRWDGFETFDFKCDNVATRRQVESVLAKERVRWYE